MKPSRCGNCGSQEVKKQGTRGPFFWRDYPKVYLIKPIALYHCEKCGERQLSLSDGKRLDGAIEGSIKAQARKFIQQIIDTENCSQVELAERLGVTPEYLSAIKHGARIPGFQTFNFLKTMLLDPKAFDAANPELSMKSLKRVAGW